MATQANGRDGGARCAAALGDHHDGAPGARSARVDGRAGAAAGARAAQACASRPPRAGGWRRWPRSSSWAPAPCCLPAPSGQRPGLHSPRGRRGGGGRESARDQRPDPWRIGAGAPRSGPARQVGRLRATPGRAHRAPRGAPQSPPSRPPRPEPAPVAEPVAAPQPAPAPVPASSPSSSDLEPGKGRGWVPARVRLRVLAVGNEMPSSARAEAAPPPRLLGLALGVLTAALALAPVARAGPYQAIQCAPTLAPGTGGFHFSRSSPEFHRVRACGSGDGLGVTHARSRTGAGGYATWVAEPPAGTYFTGGRLLARGRRHGAYRPQLLLAPGLGAPDSIGSPRRRFDGFEWRARGRADRLIAAAVLHSPDRSLWPDRQAEDLHQAGTVSSLVDASPPAVSGLGGALVAAPVQRGVQALTSGLATPARGFGWYRCEPTAGSSTPCGQAAMSAPVGSPSGSAPVPTRCRQRLSVNTLLPGFHEGQNSLTACVADYANVSPNERCARRRIRVDNDCPISDVVPALRARFAFAGGRTVKRVGVRPAAAGRRQVRAAPGAPGPAALVCVSARTRLPQLDREAGRSASSHRRPREGLGAASRRSLADRLPHLLARRGAGLDPRHPPAREAEAGAPGAPAWQASQRADDDLAGPAARAIPRAS